MKSWAWIEKKTWNGEKRSQSALPSFPILGSNYYYYNINILKEIFIYQKQVGKSNI